MFTQHHKCVKKRRSTPNIQHPTPNNQHPTTNIQHPTTNIQHSISNNQQGITNFQRVEDTNKDKGKLNIGHWTLDIPYSLFKGVVCDLICL